MQSVLTEDMWRSLMDQAGRIMDSRYALRVGDVAPPSSSEGVTGNEATRIPPFPRGTGYETNESINPILLHRVGDILPGDFLLTAERGVAFPAGSLPL